MSKTHRSQTFLLSLDTYAALQALGAELKVRAANEGRSIRSAATLSSIVDDAIMREIKRRQGKKGK